MKYLKTYEYYSINELFNSTEDYNVIEVNRTEATNYAQEIIVEIKDYLYRFIIQIKDGYMYFDYFIKDWEKHDGGDIKRNQYIGGYTRDTYNRYDFILNDSMFLSVLNAIPTVFDTFVKQAVKDGLGEQEALAIYYDCNEKRRERIYEYFFKKKLPNSEYIKDYGYFHFKFDKPILLKDFKMS